MRHSRATLLPLNVPQQFCAAPSGNALPLFRRRNVRIDPVMNKPGDTFGTAYTLGRHYSLKVFPNMAVRHPWATLLPQNVPQHFCAAPSGNTLPLFRRWRVRIEAVLNKPGDTFSTLGRRFKPTSFPNRAARHSRATYSPKVFPNSAMRHSRATLQPLNVPQQFCATPLGNITASKCSPTEPRDTLGRRYKPISFPNSSARHPRATLCHFFVAGEFALKLS